ncbi:uncharacterized protein LOC9313199 [Arabidopsis lyrata subsp. lyrata]|uniref:uncharacterized protein LOC9313199 n=1 Tax=Arabidopsis lyrata subsp. lyrata TaxID=81972 RepID=UPI000A29D18C|nr:uncharacterized protein LOC9313199 [Arabidopsis lyrata subsp. lyrata]|eukprot:XP_020880750.1 uncharacterized protein LOC9313199 [Arabidopsis lyrata subsp. lyrata]
MVLERDDETKENDEQASGLRSKKIVLAQERFLALFFVTRGTFIFLLGLSSFLFRAKPSVLRLSPFPSPSPAIIAVVSVPPHSSILCVHSILQIASSISSDFGFIIQAMDKSSALEYINQMFPTGYSNRGRFNQLS